MSRYTITPMTSHGTGAEIRGLDLSRPVSEEVKTLLNQDFARYHVLCIRDQKLSAPQFAAAGELFGPLLSQHHKDIRAVGHPEVFEIRNREIAPGKYQIAGESFHTDHSNHPCPPRATSLHTVSLPSRGGDTQFVNVHNAYDDLSDAMKRRIERLKAVHAFESRYTPRKMRELSADSRKALPPPAIHPLVRTHPDNGRKFLYLNPVRMDSIIGMEDGEAMALLGELMAHATQQRYEYRHKWLMGDMVIWDNRSVMHQANGDYDMKEVRHLYRIMIQDDPALWTAEGEKTLAVMAA
ncbi:MAG TPA: TauD/TfdA family dioxygenase [Burkholderiales bacterium]|nr:TauD/TfdA family dioxygenase [Burkholderiales bacterium]